MYRYEKKKRVPRYPTRFEQFMVARGLKPIDLCRAANVSRAELVRIRSGRDCRLSTLARILRATRIVTKIDTIQITDLFDFELAEKEG